MSKTITYDSGLQLVITVRENGDAGIRICPGEMDRGYLRIPAEHRPAFALAVLGGVTDEMVERAAHALFENFGVGVPHATTDALNDYFAKVRRVLNAALDKSA